MNLSLMLMNSAGRLPEKDVLFFNGRKMSYRDLSNRVTRVAGGLQKLGIKKGDRVAIALSNCPEFVISYFGVLHAGGVAVTLNAAATPYELTHYLTDSGARVFITGSAKADIWNELKQKVPTKTMIVVDSAKKEGSFHELIASAKPVSAVEVENDDPAVIIYTSAMNGTSMGAVLSHNNLFTNAETVRAVEGIDGHDRAIALIPLFHAFGATVNMLSMIKYGGSIVLVDRFEKERLFEILEKNRVTYLVGVPLIFMNMLTYSKGGEYDLGALKVCFSGGCAAPPHMISRFKEHFGVDIMNGYGITEAAPVVSSNRINEHVKNASVGPPIPGCSIKIVDDTGEELSCGKTGEVLVSGPNVMSGYFNNATATSAVLKDGWLHTGDLGYIDDDGFLFLTGRKKDMLITNGLNIYPKEVEKALAMHPDIDKVSIAGKPDPVKGEIVHALIVIKPGRTGKEKDIIQFARSYLAPYKVPRKIMFVNMLPEHNKNS